MSQADAMDIQSFPVVHRHLEVLLEVARCLVASGLNIVIAQCGMRDYPTSGNLDAEYDDEAMDVGQGSHDYRILDILISIRWFCLVFHWASK